MRIETKLNEDWLFHRGDISVPVRRDKTSVYNQCKTERKLFGPASYHGTESDDAVVWEKVNLPHDYVIAQDNDGSETGALGYLHSDNAWYRKHFSLSAGSTGRRILLRFDGIAGKSTVYLNGCLMRHNFSSYNTFEIDISDIVFFDRENVIAVYVNTEEPEGWWYQGGGIYRNVYLTVTDTVAIDLWGVYVRYDRLDSQHWRVFFETTVVNTGYADRLVSAESTVIAKDGQGIGTACSEVACVALREKTTVSYATEIADPLLWDCENPNLYTVKTVLKADGAMIDEILTRIGFRTVEITADRGLLLNGRPTFIRGVCAHQDFGLTGLAVPDNIARYKVSLLKEMGANGYRTSHYQQTESYMDAFDEQGFLVMDETRWFESTEESFAQLDSLIRRDRNRPSVILWSTGNEEPLHITDNGHRLHKAIAAHIRKLDCTRPITAAEDKIPEQSAIYSECDVIGINYNLSAYETVHDKYPDKPILASECCATGTVRDWNDADEPENGRIRDADTDGDTWYSSRERAWKTLKALPYVIGAYQWAGVEHRGEAAWPRVCSASGALDLFLQKKGAFYQNLCHWTDKPTAHIVPHWNFAGRRGETILVTVYTNCDELELTLNGASLGKKAIEKYGHGEWQVRYEPGELTVVGYRQGKAVCSDRRVTTGQPVALTVTQDNSFSANGNDLALFTCECRDEKGQTVPDAAEYVRFAVSAPAVIVGTGSDICDHRRVTLPQRQMYMGKIRIAVRPAAGQQRFTLTAESENCGICRTTVNCSSEDCR